MLYYIANFASLFIVLYFKRICYVYSKKTIEQIPAVKPCKCHLVKGYCSVNIDFLTAYLAHWALTAKFYERIL